MQSPCVLSLVCFVLEAERGGGVFHEQAHMQRHRTGAEEILHFFRCRLTRWPGSCDNEQPKARRICHGQVRICSP